MLVALYNKITRQTPDRGELYFYKQIGQALIDDFVPEIKAIPENDSKEYIFVFDEKFSKEAGHYGYVKTDKNTFTPFVSSNSVSAGEHDKGESKSS